MSAITMEISNNNLFVPSKFGELKVTYNGREFTVIGKGEFAKISLVMIYPKS